METTAQRVVSRSDRHSLCRAYDRDEAVAVVHDSRPQILRVPSIDDHPEPAGHNEEEGEAESRKPHHVSAELVGGEGVHDSRNRWDETEPARGRDNCVGLRVRIHHDSACDDGCSGHWTRVVAQ